MNIRRLLSVGLLATTLHAGACKNAVAPARDLAAKTAKVGADVGTAIKLTARTTDDIAIEKCVDELEKARTPAERKIDDESQAFGDWYGCKRQKECEKVNFKPINCKGFMPAR